MNWEKKNLGTCMNKKGSLLAHSWRTRWCRYKCLGDGVTSLSKVIGSIEGMFLRLKRKLKFLESFLRMFLIKIISVRRKCGIKSAQGIQTLHIMKKIPLNLLRVWSVRNLKTMKLKGIQAKSLKFQNETVWLWSFSFDNGDEWASGQKRVTFPF